MSAWSTDRREKMSALMHELKPWLKSTGPVTAEGKRRASLNGRVSKLQKHAITPMESTTHPPITADSGYLSETEKVENALSGDHGPSETKEQRELREYRAFQATLEQAN